ncbi:MAG: ferrous iron transporter B [Clostridiales bacterium]|nr:ferrous iron transporter B [Clostridiales bacterium]
MPPEIIALCGNPNTGKSTIFNTLTGCCRHTGNWSGKTVESASGVFENFLICDLPGMYSLSPKSEDEKNAADFLKNNEARLTVITADGTCLERSLILALQITDISKKAVLCINMMDEAEKKGIKINAEGLSKRLGIKVILLSAAKNRGIEELKQTIREDVPEKEVSPLKPIEEYSSLSEKLFKEFVTVVPNDKISLERRIDNIILNSFAGLFVIAAVFAFLLWLTIIGANYPSQALAYAFGKGEAALSALFDSLNVLPPVKSLVIDGVYGIVSQVVSVMLPPMAIFFPLFTFLEDLGFLPRIAFVMDRFFKGAGTSGKQTLCMCMGIGCNAAGVVSARIIESPSQRRAAILTNVFMPCNGRFPLIITLSVMFFSVSGAKSLTAALSILAALILAAAVTLPVTKLLMKGSESSFILELPPYRMPRLGQIIVRSFKERTVFVLSRALTAAIPAGIIIWFMQNINIGSASLAVCLSRLLDPVGRLMGLDGAVVTGFILGLPANEIVLPLILMLYPSTGADTKTVLLQNGWSIKTALCAVIFCLFHFPCATTLLTIKKETGSLKDTLLAAALPTGIGFGLCCFLNLLFYIYDIIL